MKTAHQNYADQGNRIYCHRINDLVEFSQDHVKNHCDQCPYLTDSFGANGIECTFDDHSTEEVLVFTDCNESEKHSQYVAVRLGMETPAEVDARLKGSGAETTELYDEFDNEDDEDFVPPPGSYLIEDLETDAENLEVNDEFKEM